MPSIQSSRVKEQSKEMARNEEIELQLQRDYLRAKNEIKILVLSAAGYDPSKLLRQMKFLHSEGYSARERDAYKEIIFSNIVASMRAVLEAMPQLDLALSPINDAHRAIVLSLPAQIEADTLPRDIADSVRGLWRDPGVKEAVRRSEQFHLNDSALYYFNSIDRIAAVNYVPTDQDIIRSRVKTTGLTEMTFRVGELTYKMLYLGGQRSERRKWLHCFENVNAVLFCASLSDYDQMLYEDESVNYLQEAFTLFDSICNSRWFCQRRSVHPCSRISICLQENLRTLAYPWCLPSSALTPSPQPFIWLTFFFQSDYFPDYTGRADYDTACDYC
ncbi:G-protein alpha subunit [Mycena leptocephala]|nr:G-protein alpha subunit [Mycena leptocephala]